MDRLQRSFGSIELCASGECVGLPHGQIGNSEVGHLTMGAGREVPSDLVRINRMIESGELSKNEKLNALLRRARRRGSTLHLLGLVSNGGVHSHINHLFALLEIAARKRRATKLLVHVILDGRDTAPKSGVNYVTSLLQRMRTLGAGEVATISGRYYAMDRDNRWERTKLAYEAIAYGKGPRFDEPIRAIRKSYLGGKTDQFVCPRVIGDYEGLEDGDALIFFNFRPDRARQLTQALSAPQKVFRGIDKRKDPVRMERKKVELLTMTEYDPKLKGVAAILRPQFVEDTLGAVLESSCLRQLRVAETEKYAHVTYFFNGLREEPSRHEKRVLVPSRRKARIYDEIPEMSARQITTEALRGIRSSKYQFILVNYANADMVGHTGNLSATIAAVESVDECLGLLIKAADERGRTELVLLITGDHGKAEEMRDESGRCPRTSHTCNRVPFVVVSERWRAAATERRDREAGLSAVSPSVLRILGLRKPGAMKAKPIVEPVS